jgi:prepilin-type N-terminal cleavage/methylation domain-containing protein
MEIKKMKKQAGFTLVEIAIVMVIIGLLLGAVLKGQEMITNARVKNIENEFNGIVAAIYSYQDRYRALPGDDDKADRFSNIADCTTSNLCGDGDGTIDGVFDSTTDNTESRLLWLHLRNAGLVTGATDDQAQPSNTLTGIIGVSTGGVANISGTFVAFTQVPQNIALIIEARLDDGQSASGRIQGLKSDGSTDAGDYADEAELYELYFAL